jgi:hypothetical protein
MRSCPNAAQTVDLGHGRIEQRNLTTSEALIGYSDWPGLAQVFELGCHVLFQKTGKERVKVVYGVTSLGPERATPEHLLTLVRGQWQIENKSHWVRDVTFDEDRAQMRCGNIPQVMAALRNTAIGLLRYAGYANIAAAGRRLAAQPLQALALIGIEPENEMALQLGTIVDGDSALQFLLNSGLADTRGHRTPARRIHDRIVGREGKRPSHVATRYRWPMLLHQRCRIDLRERDSRGSQREERQAQRYEVARPVHRISSNEPRVFQEPR